MTQRQKPELREQKMLAQWLRLQQEAGRVLKFTSVNATPYMAYYSQINQNRAAGFVKGFPDMVICLPQTLVFCEMKAPRPHSSHVSPEQKEWIGILDKYESCVSFVAYGAIEAIAKLTNLIGNVTIQKLCEKTEQEKHQGSDDFKSWLEGPVQMP